MPRRARTVLVGVPHHITHRGNRGDAVYLRASDRTQYREILREACAREGLDIWAYCLMPNHVHLLAVPRSETAIARAVGLAHQKYARWLNVRMERTGHLWTARYYSVPLDETHLLRAVRYVERNPVRAGIVQRPRDFRWSSAPAHIEAGKSGRPAHEFDALLAATSPFPGGVADWEAALAEGLNAAELSALRAATRTGLPLGLEGAEGH